MFYNDLPFKIGDEVQVTGGQFTGHIGKVYHTHASMTTCGPYSLVWVRLDERRVEAYKPEQLLLVSPSNSIRPCPTPI
jgi:hypothetical protein